ncbi:MAG: hypothetical protein G01um101413_3 [Parcubacteria group bacterium Gr01-1014_13]|nr:MAG: hypothetical protein G01um101413_3 [Parcubacteria group bacterium Gr01-1014_13]
MQYRKSITLFFFISFFSGCGDKHAKVEKPRPLLHNRPAGFWENKQAIVQVMHFYSRVNADNTGKPILDTNGKFTTTAGMSFGTGFVVDTNGLVGTNNHNVNETCPIVMAPAKITTPLPDECPLKTAITPDQLAAPLPAEAYAVCVVKASGRDCYAAEIFAADEDNDLALVQTKQRLPHAVEFVDDSDLVPGDDVYFWGNVGLFLPPSPFFGRYIGRVGPPYFNGDKNGKYYGNLLPILFMDIYLAPGNSGSPMFNGSGKVVCINYSLLPSSVMGVFGGRALGMCIPSKKFIQLRKKNPWPKPTSQPAQTPKK